MNKKLKKAFEETSKPCDCKDEAVGVQPLVRRDLPFSPVLVCSTEQIEEFRKDPNFQSRLDTGVFPIFEPNKTQLRKIKKLLEGADQYILTNDGFVKVN